LANGQSVVIIQNTTTAPVSGIFSGMPEGTLITSNGQTYGITYLGGDGNDVALIALTNIEKWRLTYFGGTQNVGTAADTFDANNDGEVNLMEFASGQNPNASTSAITGVVRNGATVEFSYTRSRAAMSDGVIFNVEWSDNLTGWSSVSVTEQILSDNGTVQRVRASVAAGASGRRFLHLKVSKP
jgi:hypothetical protein